MTSEIVNFYEEKITSLYDVEKPGRIRTVKGQTVESISKMIVREAWNKIGGDGSRLEFRGKKTRIFVRKGSIDLLPEFIRKETLQDKVYYDVSVDTQVYIDDKLVLGIECKAYTENAMLKRILVDFWLLKSNYPDIICCLLQLETWLGGKNTGIGSRIANRRTR